MTLVGGVVFILFAITSSIWDPNDSSTPPAETTGGNWDELNYFHDGLNDTIVLKNHWIGLIYLNTCKKLNIFDLIGEESTFVIV